MRFTRLTYTHRHRVPDHRRTAGIFSSELTQAVPDASIAADDEIGVYQRASALSLARTIQTNMLVGTL